MGFEEVKQRQSAVWGSGPFDEVARGIADVHDELVRRLAPAPGERWLDVATGSGQVALRAARAGARVSGIDFAPPLIETAIELAQAEGLDVEFAVGDAENLAFPDASFDVVSSCFGCMFAPDQAAAARELARVCRPGGRLGLATWNPDGQIGDVFRFTAGFAPPPAEGAGRPLDWGRPEHVTALLGDAFELEFVDATTPYEPESGEAAWELFSRAFGPVKTLADSLDPERREEFRRGFVELHEGPRTDGVVRIERAYLITLGTRR